MYKFREACIAAYGDRIIDINVGSIAHVDFDYMRIKEAIDAERRKYPADNMDMRRFAANLIFIHSHPDTAGPNPSVIDYALIARLKQTFGSQDFIFAIVTKNKGYTIIKGNSMISSNDGNFYSDLFDVSKTIIKFIDIVLKLSEYYEEGAYDASVITKDDDQT